MPPMACTASTFDIFVTTHCVTNATPFQFIDGNILKNYRMGLNNHTRPISHHITPLPINALGGGHTDKQTDRHTYQRVSKNDFKKAGVQPCVPGLTITNLI